MGNVDYSKRKERLTRALRDAKLPNLLITSPHNVTYLTGFTGEDSFLFASEDQFLIISDARYEEQLAQECPNEAVFIRPPTTAIIDAAADVFRRCALSAIAIEAQTTSVAQFEKLAEVVPAHSIVSTRGVVERIRERKDAHELASIEKAIDMAQRAFISATAMMTPDSSEKNIADEIEIGIRRLGGVSSAFKTIVGVGPRAALPHGRPSHMKLAESGFVLIDWGAKENLYLSDITRVVVTGKTNAKFEKVYRTVLAAQQAAIQAIRPGALMCDIDAVARGVIEDAGFGKRFTHSLGHSFGLEIHETVRLAKGQDRPLEPDMIVTVEPGIYLPGFGGVRIEDDVLVTKTGNRVLTSLPKEWDAIRV